MPAEDSCQPEIIVALQKAGWTITDQQIHLKGPDIFIYIDIEAAQVDRSVYIEVKCFPNLKIQ